MKKIAIFAALAVGMVSVPAMANDFAGPRAELTVGYDDINNVTDTTDVTYGAAVGFDLEALPRVTVGVEANVDNVFNRRDIGASARLGYVLVEDHVLVYGKAGYSNYKDVFSRELDGLRVGGGIDVNVVGPVYTGVEYQYADFDHEVGRHSVRTKVGIRF